MSRILVCCLFACLFCSCRHFTHSNRVVVLQPLGRFTQKEAAVVRDALDRHFAAVIVRTAVPLPQSAFYAQRNRYRADSLLRILNLHSSADTVVVGLLHEDISTTKGLHTDWGVMGLGYRSGAACVASTFRLSKSNETAQLYKVVIHELGHTQGLPHCPEKTCFMRDAGGGNPLDEEHQFCGSCSPFLKSKGWQEIN